MKKQSAFAEWDRKASVRSAPRRLLDSNVQGRDLFSRDLVPILKHPLLETRYAHLTHEILAQSLYRYLTFTINLELSVVNATTRDLICGALPFAIDGQSQLNAYRLYCDEGYHALFCADLMDQVIAATGIQPAPVGEPAFLTELRRHLSASGQPLMDRFAFTAVSETLITANLAEVRRHDATPDAVRLVMSDHAMDEARHHAFYRDLLYALMAQSTAPERVELASVLPKFVMAFIRPDTNAIRSELIHLKVAESDVDQILAETYIEANTRAYGRACASALIEYVSDLDLMKHPQVEDSFAEAGLLPSAVS